MEDFVGAEERFVLWSELLLEADTVECRKAVGEFVELMAADEVCFYIWNEWAQLYLYGVWSPTRNDMAFEMLLRSVQADPRVADIDKEYVPRLLGILDHNQVGEMAQDFPFYDKDERRGELSDFRGRNVLLLLIDTTCPSCLDVMQEIEQSRVIMEAVADGRVEMVAISLGVIPSSLQELIEEKEGTPWRIYSTGRNTLEEAHYDTSAAPIFLLLAPDGSVEVSMTRDVKLVESRLRE